MAELKTKANDGDVEAFLASVEDDGRRQDARDVLALMADVTGEEPRMWGDSIVGFGTYTYRYASGRTGEWMATGFSPRKQALTLYIMSGFEGYDAFMDRLGTYKTGKSCLYVKRLDDVDLEVLRALIAASVESIQEAP